jgi:antitoxin CptB
MTEEVRENRLKRLHMRSARRGIKEMDILLGNFANDELERLPDADLDIYEELLHENDQDMLRWVTGLDPVPERYADLFGRISSHAFGRDKG